MWQSGGSDAKWNKAVTEGQNIAWFNLYEK